MVESDAVSTRSERSTARSSCTVGLVAELARKTGLVCSAMSEGDPFFGERLGNARLREFKELLGGYHLLGWGENHPAACWPDPPCEQY